MTFDLGDRVRCTSIGDDGLPLIRYGFVRSMLSPDGAVVVMFDGEIRTEIVEQEQIAVVSVINLELTLAGDDLLDDPELRRGLLPLWQAEAETAGLDVDSVEHVGRKEGANCWALAVLGSGGMQYVLRAIRSTTESGGVVVRAEFQLSDGTIS